MNYRHAYHAGNFADVFKHAVLAQLLAALGQKDKPYCYIETHAGAGRYDLQAEAARKTGEYQDGIGRLWALSDPPPQLAAYLAVVRALNGDALRHYPGSPIVARHLMRKQDRLVLCELQPDEVEALGRGFARDPQVSVHAEDGLAALSRLVPPSERRGLVLIDPPYERPEELRAALSALTGAHARWSSGVYALWYPIKDETARRAVRRELTAAALPKTLSAELCVYPADSAFRLNGCGVAIVNPPWSLETELRAVGEWLRSRLARAPGATYHSDWLVPETAARV